MIVTTIHLIINNFSNYKIKMSFYKIKIKNLKVLILNKTWINTIWIHRYLFVRMEIKIKNKINKITIKKKATI